MVIIAHYYLVPRAYDDSITHHAQIELQKV